MRLGAWTALVTAVVVAGCGSAAEPTAELVPGLLHDATAPAGSGCPDAAAFDALLDATGVARDYEPTYGPRNLALATDAVIRGRLTGRAEPLVGDVGPALDLGIEVTEVVLGEELSGISPPLSRLRVTVSPRQLPGAATSVPALEGLEVVAFISVQNDGQEEAGKVGAPAAEGLMSSCAEEGLVGWHGEGPGWALLELDDVSLGALGLPDSTAVLEGRWDQVGVEGPGLEVARGTEHCGLESTLIAGVGNYDRMFIRDPEGAADVDLVGSLDPAAPPPVGLLSTVRGASDERSVRFALVDGEQGLAVDLGDGRWERWPEVLSVFG